MLKKYENVKSVNIDEQSNFIYVEIEKNIEEEQYKFKSKAEAWRIVGGLSEPGKMPGYGWSIPASECKRGSYLRHTNKNSICANCYAMKNRYKFKNVQDAQYNRLEKFKNPLWVQAMSHLIKETKYFRWFDSGDLQSLRMLKKIVEVCNNTPDTKHWLPTREHSIVLKYLDMGFKIPDNLCIRMSADEVNIKPVCEIKGCQIATVSDKDVNQISNHTCPVSYNKDIKSCKDAGCYSCWNKNIHNITYHIH